MLKPVPQFQPQWNVGNRREFRQKMADPVVPDCPWGGMGVHQLSATGAKMRASLMSPHVDSFWV